MRSGSTTDASTRTAAKDPATKATKLIITLIKHSSDLAGERKLTDRMMIVSFSFGNWPIYMLAVGYDSSSLRWNRWGSSLNSLNFHSAKGVYFLPPIEEGLLWYSYESISNMFVK